MQKLAKSNPRQTIQNHTESTVRISKKLAEYAGCDEKITSYMVVASLFHDIGKVISDFQRHLADETHQTHIPHNIVSFMIMKDHVRPVDGDINYYKAAMKAVLLHHPIEEYGNNKNTQSPHYIIDNHLPDIDIITDDDLMWIRNLIKWAIEYNNKNNTLLLEYVDDNDDSLIGWDECKSPFLDNASKRDRKDEYYLAISGNLKCADTLASKCNDGTLTEKDIKDYYRLSHNVSSDDFKCPSHYNETRFKEQINHVKNITSKSNGFDEINDPVGSGKTDVMLMSALCMGKKILYVLPTNSTAINGYHSITDFLKTYGLSEKVSVGLLLTNEWVEGQDKEDLNDIIVTNIDNTLRPLFKSDKRKRMAYDLYYRTMIFDEYHMYFSKSALMRAFVITINSRNTCQNVKTLLASATPMKCLLDRVDVNRLPITKAGCEKRRLRIHYSIPDYSSVNTNICTIVNSVSKCQKLAKDFNNTHNNNTLVYHSAFTKEDRTTNEERIISTYGKEAVNNDDKPCVFSTNIISTGINVSFKTVVLYGMPLFELYQCMGRCNRWGEFDVGDVYITFESMNEPNERGAINSKWDIDVCQKEMKLLRSRLHEGEYTIPQIHDIIMGIMNEISYNKQMDRFMSESRTALSRIPYRYGLKKSVDNEVEVISSNPSLRDGISDSHTTELFVWCEGMEDGTCIRASINTKDFGYYDFADHMIKKKKIKNTPNINKLVDEAKDSRKPFILNPKYYRYSTRYGLMRQHIKTY